MREVYPVYFTRTDTVVLVEVPDLEILTEGKDMNDAIDMARMQGRKSPSPPSGVT